MRRLFGVAALLMLAATPVAADALAPYERGTFAKIRAAHAAHPLIVHFWSVTCIPCLVEMPRLAAFSHDHRDVDLVFVSTDPIAQASRIESRLEKFELLQAENFAYADSFEERLRFEVDRNWRGELPFTALIANGSVKTVVGELDPAALKEWMASAAH